jgi:membrane protease YdiL (CAAX protease family)
VKLNALHNRLTRLTRCRADTARREQLASHKSEESAQDPAALAVGLCLTVVLPIADWPARLFANLPQLLHEGLGTRLTSARALLIAVQWLAAVLLLVALVRLWERKSWASLGIKLPSAWDPLLVLAFFLLGFTVQIHLVMPFFARPRAGFPGGAGDWEWTTASLYRYPGVALLCAADALVEEIGSRAYVVERFSEMTGSLAAGGAVSWMVSVAMHVPFWGGAGALQRAPWLLVYVCFYVWRRNLWASTLLHAISQPVIWLPLLASAPPTIARISHLLLYWH